MENYGLFETSIYLVYFISLFAQHLFSFWAALPVEPDLSEEVESGWQPDHRDPSAASISGGAQSEKQQAEHTYPTLLQRYNVCLST